MLRIMSVSKLADGTVHKLPADFRKALAADAVAKALWTDFTPLARNEWICWVTSAKQDTTRMRRIAVGLDKMHSGMRRPCCWIGCIHRADKAMSRSQKWVLSRRSSSSTR